MLKVTALTIMAPMALEKMSPARGLCNKRARGMMGRGTNDSTYRKRGKQTAKIERDVITRGCVQGNTLPPRFCQVLRQWRVAAGAGLDLRCPRSGK